MFFKDYLNGLAEIIDIKYKSSHREGINSADIGELCELFMKDFLLDYLDDHYKVYRGGNIVNKTGFKSPQMDVVLTNKNSLKIFGDKGIYPIESVAAVFSITSTLTVQKLRNCITELGKIPKYDQSFTIEKFYGNEFQEQTLNVWKNLIPFTCIFAFKGDIEENWMNKITDDLKNIPDKSLWPSIIIVNKKGMFEKTFHTTVQGTEVNYFFTSIDSNENFGECFSKILFHLHNQSAEQLYLRPRYENYFEKDYQ